MIFLLLWGFLKKLKVKGHEPASPRLSMNPKEMKALCQTSASLFTAALLTTHKKWKQCSIRQVMNGQRKRDKHERVLLSHKRRKFWGCKTTWLVKCLPSDAVTFYYCDKTPWPKASWGKRVDLARTSTLLYIVEIRPGTLRGKAPEFTSWCRGCGGLTLSLMSVPARGQEDPLGLVGQLD